MGGQTHNLSILHLFLSVTETSAPYNEHCLPWAGIRDIAICTYFRSELTPPKTIRYFEGDGTLAGFVRSLRAALNDRQYDVIHTHSPHVGLLLLLVALFSKPRALSSAVVTIHDSYQDFKFRNRLMLVPVFAAYRRVVCCSQASYDSFPAVFRRLAGRRLRAVQNGLDIERVDRVAANIAQPSPLPRDFRIVAISRLVAVKNPSAVIAAFQQSADENSRLVQIGAGPLRDSLIAQRSDAGLDGQVEFTGLIPREQVFQHLLGADLFISASRGEGLPVAVLEAMACRRPVLLSDIPPHREIAAGTDFIPLVRPDDTSGFAREIIRFREMSADERADVGRRCRKLVEKRFSLAAMHAGYARVYAEIHDRRADNGGESG